MIYIYGIFDKNECLYVGKSRCAFSRISHHLNESEFYSQKRFVDKSKYKRKNGMYLHLNKMMFNGDYPSVKILDIVDEDNCYYSESTFIKKLNARYNFMISDLNWEPKFLSNTKNHYKKREEIMLQIANQINIYNGD